MTAPEMQETLINDRWRLLLPKHRATRPGWPFWERDALHALWLLIRPGDVVWDIGAEEGDLSALYASWGARVFPIESSARSWPWIKATFEANGYKPEGYFHGLVGPPPSYRADGGFEIDWPDAAHGPFVPEAGFTHLNEPPDDLPVVTLDLLSADFQPLPNMIVMDIEGAEYRVLLGAEELLHELRPTFAISVHPEFMRDRYGDTPDDLLVLMELAGYEARYLGFTHEYHWIFKPRP